MKTIITVLPFLTFLILSSCGQNTNSNQPVLILKSSILADSIDFVIKDFKPLPDKYRPYLIDKIVPEINYAYWECVFRDDLNDNNRGSIIVYNGDSLNYSPVARKINSNYGFFVECHPGICFSYIIGVHADKTYDLINSDEKLRKFIGHIDNIEEAILIAKVNGYSYDTDTIIGGAYKERDNDFLLYLLDYSMSPVTFKSVKAVLIKDGDFRVIDKTIYKQTEMYIDE